MKKNFIIKKSKISGKGVFAGREYKKGEVVLIWKPKMIKKSEVDKLPRAERPYVARSGKRYCIMQPPERYINHSCEPNTKPVGKSDVANRNIEKGEEITSDYSGQSITVMKCKCGSKKCRKIIR